MIEAFSAVVPVFLLIGLGVCLDIFRALPENAHQTMSLYVLNVALPLLLFQIMATAPLESFAHPQFWLGVIAAQFLIYGACYAADRILARHNSATATVTALGGCFCNAAFVGIPVITSALPGNAEALFVAGLFTITPNLLFVVGQVQLAAHDPSRSMPQGRKAVLLHVLRYSLLYNAVFWGMAGGVLVSALGLGLWDPLNRAAELVGHTAAPCMLVTLGLTLRERLAVVLRHAGRHALLRQTALQVCKLVVQPLVCWAILAASRLYGRPGYGQLSNVPQERLKKRACVRTTYTPDKTRLHEGPAVRDPRHCGIPCRRGHRRHWGTPSRNGSLRPAILRYYPRSCWGACAPPGASTAPALSPLTAYR